MCVKIHYKTIGFYTPGNQSICTPSVYYKGLNWPVPVDLTPNCKQLARLLMSWTKCEFIYLFCVLLRIGECTSYTEIKESSRLLYHLVTPRHAPGQNFCTIVCYSSLPLIWYATWLCLYKMDCGPFRPPPPPPPPNPLCPGVTSKFRMC